MTHRSQIILVVMTSARSAPHIPRFRALLLGFAFFSFAVLAACDRQSTPRPGSDVTELSRVTSPNGQLDAVLTQDLYGGAVGGVDSEVYIDGGGTNGTNVAPRVGAWIETYSRAVLSLFRPSRPAWARGLKLTQSRRPPKP
jgi:hypothetical protein